MLKRQFLVISLLAATSVATIGCVQYTSAKKEQTPIKVIKDTKAITPPHIIASKVDIYEGITGYDWLNEDKILMTKENEKLEEVETAVGNFKVKNMFLYDLRTKESIGIHDQSKFQDGGIFSPDRKHIFYRNQYQKQGAGYIIDENGNLTFEILDADMDPYDLSEAQWINDEEIIMPCSSIRGFAVININGTITKIKDVESGVMGTQDLLNGLSMPQPMKVGDKIYYTTIKSGSEENNKLRVYDIEKKDKKTLVTDEVLEFKVSPNQQQILMTTFNSETYLNELILIDLEGQNRQVLAEGGIYGARWSKDGKNIAYISNEEGDKGIYLIEVETNKKSLVSSGEYYIPMAWSPEGDKIMAHGKVAKKGENPFDEMDVTYIISLK